MENFEKAVKEYLAKKGFTVEMERFGVTVNSLKEEKKVRYLLFAKGDECFFNRYLEIDLSFASISFSFLDKDKYLKRKKEIQNFSNEKFFEKYDHKFMEHLFVKDIEKCF